VRAHSSGVVQLLWGGANAVIAASGKNRVCI
jgi:hypothetical protein